MAVLELSKLIMYKLRYDILAKYCNEFNENIKIMDTDSFFLKVHIDSYIFI